MKIRTHTRVRYGIRIVHNVKDTRIEIGRQSLRAVKFGVFFEIEAYKHDLFVGRLQARSR